MPISFDALTKIISITTPTAEATAQELVDACRDWEDELPNMTYEKVVDAVGKADLGGGVTTGIVMTLSDAWQIQFWGGSGVSKVTGGTIVGGVGGEPIKATGTAGDLTIQIQPTDATITTANTDAIQAKTDTIDWTDVKAIKQIEQGRWKIIGNQMIFYDVDGVTPLLTFDLKDGGGSPSEDNVKERVPV